jgi:hypothetical protein
MDKDYVIAWKSNSTARMGRGKNLMEQQEAELLAAQLNAEHPEFHHIAIQKDAQDFGDLFPIPEREPLFDITALTTSVPATEDETDSAAGLTTASATESVADLAAEKESDIDLLVPAEPESWADEESRPEDISDRDAA